MKTALSILAISLATFACNSSAPAPEEKASTTSEVRSMKCEHELSQCHHTCFSEYCGDKCEEKYDDCVEAQNELYPPKPCRPDDEECDGD